VATGTSPPISTAAAAASAIASPPSASSDSGRYVSACPGSGPGGVNASAPLVGAGKRVLMLDFGNEDRRYAPLIPHEPFSTVRRTDVTQHRYFIGDGFEGARRRAAQP